MTMTGWRRLGLGLAALAMLMAPDREASGGPGADGGPVGVAEESDNGPREDGRPLSPALVRLDFTDRPVSEVVAELSRRSGIALQLLPEGPEAAWRGQRVDLAAEAPVPFWEATDRLARAARLEVGTRIDLEHRSWITLESIVRPPGPAVIDGVFRCGLLGLVHERTIVYGDPRLEVPIDALRKPARLEGKDIPPSWELFYAVVRLLAEPRPLLDVRLAGPPKVVEATDDRGRSLRIEKPAEFEYDTKYRIESHFARLDLKIFLEMPDPPGRSLRRLRGTIPVVLWGRRAGPLDVPLVGTAGRSFRGAGVTLTVVSGPAAGGGAVMVEMRPDESIDAVGPGGPLFDILPGRMFFDYDQQFEVREADGTRLDVGVSTTPADGPGAYRVTLTPKAARGPIAPARLRYHGLKRVQVEVPFAFDDIPLP
jgi:hypothetical protein